MAQNEEPNASEAQVLSNPSSEGPNETPHPEPHPDSQPRSEEQADNGSAFSHPGAKLIAQRAEDGDGPYRCRKCGEAVLTVSVRQCPGCLDTYPWLSLVQDEEPEAEEPHA